MTISFTERDETMDRRVGLKRLGLENNLNID